jgi:hypothetical protein
MNASYHRSVFDPGQDGGRATALSPLRGRRSSEQGNLFYEPLLSTYLDATGTIARTWLRDEIQERLSRPNCRFVLLIGEPGAGKTGLMAALARSNPDWLRYFVRLDSTTPLSGGDAVSMMMRVGHQLAHLHPEIFDPELLEIEVTQRIEQVDAGAFVAGVKIEDLKVSPFYRTAIRVQQNVTSLAGGLSGIEISRAITEPRLLELDTLSHLALFDPALVLARKVPGEKIVLLVDALDELMTVHGANTVLDWLESSEEPPPNIRFVLSSRPHARLRALESTRSASLEIVHIDAESDQVAADVRVFATTLFDYTRALEKAPNVNREGAVTSLVRAAQGNFAYLTAYGRSLRAALAAGSAEQVGELLEFESLPAGLPQLYVTFARRMRRQIEAIGQLEIALPRSPSDEFVPAWEGVGQRLLGVLSVAFAPLTLKQLVALGGIRVWESAASNVLQTLVPFLDESGAGWKLFHTSLGEFLKSANQQGAADVAIDAREWHTKIIRYYRGAAGWAELNWRLVDSYGLLHVAAHLADASDDPLAICELVTPSLRATSKERFLSELPFRRIVETARATIMTAKSVDSVLSEGVFTQLVLSGLSEDAERLDPAVYGLMARLGRVEEALARAEVHQPGLRKYRALEAIWRSTPADSRAALGPLDGVEILVGAAVEVPTTAGPIVGTLGYDRATCLHDAALALVAHDLDRALSLAEWADKYGRVDKARDVVLGTAATMATPAKALELLAQQTSKRLYPAVEAAEKAGAGPDQDDLITFAMAHLEDEELRQRLPLVARLIVVRGTGSSDRARETAASLRMILDQLVSAESSAADPWAAVRAAEILYNVDGQLAARILETCDRPEVDVLLAHALLQAARVWASWGRLQDARTRLTRALDAFRALDWYGPARDIAEAAGIAAVINPEWGEQLAQEAIALVEPEVKRADDYESGRLDAILAGMVSQFKQTNRERALKVARWISGGWIHGANWDSSDGRGGALAIIGIEAAQEDPALAAQLLSECLAQGETEVRLGRADPVLVHAGLFRRREETTAMPPGTVRSANFISYISNEVNYWTRGRKWRFFRSPAEVLRSVDETFPATASWARVVGAAVASVAATDLEKAIAMAYWPADPGERLIGLAGLSSAFSETDPRLQTTLTNIATTLTELPQYEPEVDLERIPQAPILLYLDPTIRARFEAALLLPSDSDPYRLLPKDSEEFWYIQKVYQAESLFNELLAGTYSGCALDDFEQQMNAASQDYSVFDDLLKDLLEVAATYALASKDILRADTRIERISNPSLKASAKLLRLQFDEPGNTSRATEALKMLNALSDEVSPLHRAELAVTAVGVCESTGEDASAIFEWALKELEGVDPLMITRGLTALSAVVPEGRRSTLLSQALNASDQIRNQYLRGDAVANLLGMAVTAGDSALVASILDRLLAAGWICFVEGLRRAVPDIVRVGGAEIIERMDLSMRRAQAMLWTQPSSSLQNEHFDGVLSAPLREEAQKSAWNEASQSFQAYLSTFLDQIDVGPLYRWVQDSRLHRPDDSDDAFARLHGRRTGLSVWLAAPNQRIWHIVDIRFEFDSASDAAAYQQTRMKANSEGKPEVPDAPAVGEDCHVFGGTDSIQMGGNTISMTAYFYIFRVGRVVAKLFVASGPEAGELLLPDHLAPVAERIRERILSAGLGQE